jgi:uncharacterized membrane protein
VSVSRLLALALAAAGTLVSAYLTWVHYSGSLALCIGVGGCEAVQTSRYSTIGPIPVALVGLAGFVAILAAAIAHARGAAWSLTPLFALSLAATLYVAYLTYVEVFVLGAICPWCVAVAVCSVGVFALALRDLLTESDI